MVSLHEDRVAIFADARRIEGHARNVGWRQPADTDQLRRRQFPDALTVTASFRTTHVEAPGPRFFWSRKFQASRRRLSRSSSTPSASIILPSQVGGRCFCQSAVAPQVGRSAASAGARDLRLGPPAVRPHALWRRTSSPPTRPGKKRGAEGDET
jgi:hypothetical protein